MEFNWTPKRKSRLAAAVRAYNSTITRKVNELKREGRDIEANQVQRANPKITVNSIKEEIHSENDFHRIVGYAGERLKGRPSRLDRILKSVNPDALEVVWDYGGYNTNYNLKESKYAIRLNRKQIAKEREDFQKPLYDGDDKTKSFDEMSKPEYANAIDNTNMGLDDEGEEDKSVEDLDPTTYNAWNAEDIQKQNARNSPVTKYYEYLGELTSIKWTHRYRDGYSDFVHALERLAHNRTDVLNKTFNAGYDWVDPLYLFESGETPYQIIDIEYRYAVARDNWLEIYYACKYDNS